MGMFRLHVYLPFPIGIMQISNPQMSSQASIVFMGTPEFAVPALQAVHAEFGVRAVVTVPDKPSGRGQKLYPSAVKQAAIDCGINTILQPESLKSENFASQMHELAPDVLCVIAFRILPRSIYSLARLGAFNVHASLLPKYRGAAPINHAIINGERESGVSSFLLNDVVDTGNILLQEHLPITDGMTAGELYEALMPLAAKLAVQTTRALLGGSVQPLAQDNSLASPAPKVWRDECAIPWSDTATRVRNFIHGVSPTPCAWTLFGGERLKIYRAQYTTAMNHQQLPPGSWRMTENEWIVGCGEGSLSLTEIQLPGKAMVRTTDFLRGWRANREGVFS